MVGRLKPGGTELGEAVRVPGQGPQTQFLICPGVQKRRRPHTTQAWL